MGIDWINEEVTEESEQPHEELEDLIFEGEELPEDG